jgi:hypothetical protein
MKPEHLLEIKKNRLVSWIDSNLTPEKAVAVAEMPYSTTIFDDAGNLLLVGGVIEHWNGRGEIWGFLAEGTLAHLSDLTRTVRAWVEALPHRRIEAVCATRFKAAQRFLKRLGFEQEVGVLRSYSPIGEDSVVYAIVRKQGE